MSRPENYTRLTDGVMREIVHLSEKYNNSQISAMTGVKRKTVADFLNEETHKGWWRAYRQEQEELESTYVYGERPVYKTGKSNNPVFKNVNNLAIYDEKGLYGESLPKQQSLLTKVKEWLVGKIQKMLG